MNSYTGTISTFQAPFPEFLHRHHFQAPFPISRHHFLSRHHFSLLWMMEAFARVRKDGAVGVDGQTASEYAKELESNLADLLERAKSGRYRAPPVKRVMIPKNEHEMRPIGIPTLEDKILQRAVAMVLEPIYEQDFLDCSYGFRPKRSVHQALDAVREGLRELNGGWVLDVDIKAFFDMIPHDQLREILRTRINDSVNTRLLHKWLKAGVMIDGAVHGSTGEGTPQGGVISPILSNIYLHEVLDRWFTETVQPRMKGKAKLIRYADDFVIIFERLDDAQRVLDVLSKRFERYGLTVHPEKTRLVDFIHPWEGGRKPEIPRRTDAILLAQSTLAREGDELESIRGADEETLSTAQSTHHKARDQ